MTAVGPVLGLDVYTELPTLSDGQQPEWVWTKLLSIPAPDLEYITKRIAAGRPWRWILFACGVILGTERGTLSLSTSPAESDEQQFPYAASLGTTAEMGAGDAA